MQPNEQKQPNPNDVIVQSTDYSSTNVPDYLHLDPIPAPKAKRSKKWLVILLVLLLVSAVGAVMYWLWFYNTPSNVLYRSLGNLMTVNAIQRDMNINASIDGVFSEDISMKVVSDFSDVNTPKSSIDYTYQLDNKGDASKNRIIKGELVVLSTDRYYARLDKVVQPEPLQAALNEWKQISRDSDASTYLYDRQALRVSVNNPLMQVFLAGSFKAYQSDFINYIRKNNIYVLNSANEQEKDGSKYRVMKISIDHKKFSEFGRFVNDQTKQRFQTSGLSAVGSLELWIDNNDQVAYFTENVTQTTDGLRINMRIDTKVSYPQDVSITEPGKSQEK